jgi:hypothetical protein
MNNKRVLVVNNFVFDNTPDLFKLLTKIRDEYKTLPKYIDYITYKGTNFLEFITEKYNKGYRIIIGTFYSSQCLTTFDFLNKHQDLLLISSSSTAIFESKVPFNLLRIPSTDEKAFLLFKKNILDSANEALLLLDPTLSNFPKQKEIIVLNEKTFIKTVNVLYTDEDIYNISYVNLIKRTITGNEQYKFNFVKIPASIISQKKLTKEAVKILYTNDTSNVFIIITIAYPQQFLNILSNNITFSSQILFLSDIFSAYSLKIKTQLPYAFTLVNDLEPLNIDYYQRTLFNNNPGYINTYNVTLLQFIIQHIELLNNTILFNLSIKNFVKILSNSNEFIKSQPVNNNMSLLQINYLTTAAAAAAAAATTTVPATKRISKVRSLLNSVLSSKITVWSTLSKTIRYVRSTSTKVGSIANLTSFALYDLIVIDNNQTILDDYKMFISGLNYIKDTFYNPDKTLKLLYFINTNDFNKFIKTVYPRNTLYYYFTNYRLELLNFNKSTSKIIPSNTIITLNNQINMTKKEFFNNFISFINNVIIKNI